MDIFVDVALGNRKSAGLIAQRHPVAEIPELILVYKLFLPFRITLYDIIVLDIVVILNSFLVAREQAIPKHTKIRSDQTLGRRVIGNQPKRNSQCNHQRHHTAIEIRNLPLYEFFHPITEIKVLLPNELQKPFGHPVYFQ
jgi:hypothetical protein